MSNYTSLSNEQRLGNSFNHPIALNESTATTKKLNPPKVGQEKRNPQTYMDKISETKFTDPREQIFNYRAPQSALTIDEKRNPPKPKPAVDREELKIERPVFTNSNPSKPEPIRLLTNYGRNGSKI